ncbi:glycosyltransferase family 2 protein [Bacteroidota bacterium]
MFDVILPTYNNLDELKSCLKGFSEQTLRDYNVIICIDGSTDGTIEYLKTAEYNFDFKYIQHPANEHRGRNETRNLSLTYITSEFLLLFDTDIIPDKNLLQKHFDLLQSRDCISNGDVIYKNTNQNVWALYLKSRGKGKYADRSEIPHYYLNTQNVSFRSEYFLILKGQDPDLSKNYGGDDTILGYRMGRDFNLPVIFNKTAIGYSTLDKNLNTALNQMREFGAVNLKLIRKKYPEFRQIFRFDIVESKLLRHRLIRFFISDKIARLLPFFIQFAPAGIKIKIVHFLVFLYIYKGYKTGEY